MDLRVMPVSALAADPKNLRLHPERNLEGIKASLRRFGQRKPIVVRDGVVVAGNGTLVAAKAIGLTELFVVSADDLTPQEARAFAIADNRTAELAEWDVGSLVTALQELPAVELPSVAFSTGDLAALIDQLEHKASGKGHRSADEIPALPTSTRVELGALFRLGDHLILCGDSTKDLARLMDGAKADCSWTDPPYGVDYAGGAKPRALIDNDGSKDLPAFLRQVFEAVDAQLKPGAAIYCAHPAGANSLVFGNTGIAVGWRYHEGLVWVKDSIVPGHSDYHYRHEPIALFYKQGGGRRGRGGDGWFGGNDADSVFEIPRPKRSDDHPTAKPVELVARMLRNSCARGGLVLEPFSGSGTTIIAGELTGRHVRACELVPGYVQVAIERWELYTGRTAEKV